MSLLTGETVQFNFPEKPDTDYPLNVANSIVAWAAEALSPKIGGDYRPEMALLRGRVLNCYGVSSGIVDLAENWDLPAAICLERNHATPFVKIGETVLAIEMFGTKPQITKLPQTAGNIQVYNYEKLAKLYEDTIPKKMEEGNFSMYFTPSGVNGDNTWSVRHTNTIKTNTDLTKLEDAHIVVDASSGKEMLRAFGDLVRYKHKNPNRYEELLPELISFIPDFIDIQTYGDAREEE